MEFPKPEQQWIVSASPHVHCGSSVRQIMLDVIIALVPALVAAVVFFGLNALRLVVVCTGSCVLTEALCRKLMGRDCCIDDFSAVLTGVLLAFSLPPYLPSWMAVAGSVIAIGIAKQAFGGLGYNPFNPALVARAALVISCAREMNTWSEWVIPAPALGVDAVSQATPLGKLQTAAASAEAMPYVFDAQTAWQFFVGKMNGCIGEVSALALLIGGVYLLCRRRISWHTPVCFIGAVAVFSCVLWLGNPSRNMNPAFHLLTGGVMLGAIFMATDMVTTPATARGKIVFGVGCGALTMVIRKWGSLPEGVSFAILLMNSVTPLINMATRPRVFGHRRNAWIHK